MLVIVPAKSEEDNVKVCQLLLVLLNKEKLLEHEKEVIETELLPSAKFHTLFTALPFSVPAIETLVCTVALKGLDVKVFVLQVCSVASIWIQVSTPSSESRSLFISVSFLRLC